MYSCIKISKLMILLTILVVGLVVGCSNEITNSTMINTPIEARHRSANSPTIIDELWIISIPEISGESLTIHDIQQMIEEHFASLGRDEEIDVDLLNEFILESIGDLEVITDQDEIVELLAHIHVCCVYNPNTGKTELVIIVR